MQDIHCAYCALFTFAGEELHKLTGCHVSVRTIPTWSRGIPRSYCSPGYPFMTPRASTATSPTVSLTTSSPQPPRSPTVTRDRLAAFGSGHSTTDSSTPTSSRQQTQRQSPLEVNVCQVCHIRFGSEVDKRMTQASHWVWCATTGCKYWVHAYCCGIYYENYDSGEKALNKWSKTHISVRDMLLTLKQCILMLDIQHV